MIAHSFQKSNTKGNYEKYLFKRFLSSSKSELELYIDGLGYICGSIWVTDYVPLLFNSITYFKIFLVPRSLSLTFGIFIKCAVVFHSNPPFVKCRPPKSYTTLYSVQSWCCSSYLIIPTPLRLPGPLFNSIESCLSPIRLFNRVAWFIWPEFGNGSPGNGVNYGEN